VRSSTSDRTEGPSDRAVRSLVDDRTPDEPQPSGRQVQELEERLPGDDLRRVQDVETRLRDRADEPGVGSRLRRQVDAVDARTPELLAATTPEAGGDLAERLGQQEATAQRVGQRLRLDQRQRAAQQSVLDSRLGLAQDTRFETDLRQAQRFGQRQDLRQDQRQELRQDQRRETELRQDLRLNTAARTNVRADTRTNTRAETRPRREFEFDPSDDRQDERDFFGEGLISDDRVFDTGVAQSVDEALSRFDEADEEGADGGAFDFDFSRF